MRKTLLDTDKLNLVGLRPVGNAAMAVTDALQRFPSEVQVVGAAAHFILLAKRYRLNPAEAFNIAERVIRSQHRVAARVSAHSMRTARNWTAAETYMEYELH
jgi:hypothetical protein